MTVPLEAVEAQILANWLRENNYMFHHSPNETYTKSWSQKRKNTLEGVSSGFPDYCIILKRGALLFIELKRCIDYSKSSKGRIVNKATEKQLEWKEKLHIINNVEAHICYGAEEAKSLIKEIEGKQ